MKGTPKNSSRGCSLNQLETPFQMCECATKRVAHTSRVSISSLFSPFFVLHLQNFSSGAVCDYMSLYVHAHAKWACITWHGIICIESSFNFQNHPFTNMLLTGHTLIDKIDHFCTFLSVLIKANWTLFPVSHTYIWSIAQWAIQRQCVKKISAVQKRIEEKKWEIKGKTLFMT